MQILFVADLDKSEGAARSRGKKEGAAGSRGKKEGAASTKGKRKKEGQPTTSKKLKA